MNQTFIDMIVVCSITGFTIIATGAWQSGDTGALVHESGVRLRGGRPDWMDEVESPSYVQDTVPRPELGRL